MDSSFDAAALALRLDTLIYHANWHAHGRAAGPIRNAQMVKAGADLCIAVHRDLKASKGTKDCVRRALEAGIPTRLIDSEDGEMKPLESLEGEERVMQTDHDHDYERLCWFFWRYLEANSRLAVLKRLQCLPAEATPPVPHVVERAGLIVARKKGQLMNLWNIVMYHVPAKYHEPNPFDPRLREEPLNYVI